MLLIAGLGFVGHQIRIYFIIWVLGALIAIVVQSPLVLSKRVKRALTPLSLLLLIATLAARRAYFLPLGFGVIW